MVGRTRETVAKAKADPILLELLKSSLTTAAEEMEAVLLKTARSACIKEVGDGSCAIFDSKGRTIAEAAAIAIHLGSMQAAIQNILTKYIPLKDWDEGDMVMINDPYFGGTHLPDVMLFRPVFYEHELVAFCGSLGHMVDIGGIAPGGTSPLGAEIYQEGLRIPPVKLFVKGSVNKDIQLMLMTNVRAPDTVWADLQAVMYANETGSRAIKALCKRYSTARLKSYVDELLDYSERMIRSEISHWKEGTIQRTMYLDDDGRNLDRPIKVVATLQKSGSNVTIDFTGTDKQVAGPVNCVPGTLKSAVTFAVVAMASPDIPHNEGCGRPITVILPEGTIVNPHPPAPVALRHLAAFRIGDMILSALSEIVPGKGIAESDGPLFAFNIAGTSEKTGQYFSDLSTMGGGAGARTNKDGINAVSHNLTNALTTPSEAMEMNLPVMCDAFELIPDSGGMGQYRGGLGVRRVLRMTQNGITFVWRVERSKNPAKGIFGGREGRPSRVIFKDKKGERVVPHTGVLYDLQKGDTLTLESAGGGGCGDPQLRSQDIIRYDLQNGYITSWNTS